MRFPPDGHPFYPPPYEPERKETTFGYLWPLAVVIGVVVIFAAGMKFA